MGVVSGVVGQLRRRSAVVLDAYGRAVVEVARAVAGDGAPTATRRIAPASGRPVIGPAQGTPHRDAHRASTPHVAPTSDPDGGPVDLPALRSAALDCVLAAASDPGRSAADRFAARGLGVSDWTAGRLLADAGRMREAALDAFAASGDFDGAARRRAVTATLHRRFPWLDDDALARLWEHVVRHAPQPAAQDDPGGGDDDPEPGRRGGLLGRLRRRG